MAERGKLTAKRIERGCRSPGRYGDGHGLYLQVTGTGVRSWILRYERNDKERWMGLGPLHCVNLHEARERARKARQLLLDRIDPLDARRAERQTQDEQARKKSAIPTFEEAAKRYYAIHGNKWRNAKHRWQFLASLKYVFPRLGKLQVNEITTDDVLAALEPIWERIPETASRVRGRIESILSWSIANKHMDRLNPARWADNLIHLLPAQKPNVTHHPALRYDELPGFMEQLSSRAGVGARALEFTILTAARTSELIGARWDEIDLKERVWVVPAGRMKGGKEHRVPLAKAALELLEALPTERGNDYVFIGPRARGLSNMAMATVLRRMGRNDITVHGFRSTFRDWAAERTSYPNHVVEMALAHAIGNAVEKAYRRGDLFEKRRKLMEAWEAYASRAVPAQEGATVTALRAVR